MPDPRWPSVIPIPEATVDYISPDPSTTTRTDFTDFFQRFQHAPDAHPTYTHYFTKHQQLAKLLIEHPAMRPNLEQTFSTKANSKNKVYFMWDFVLRTFQLLAAQVSPQDPYSSPAFSDIVGRVAMAEGLILDDTGKLEAGNASFGYSDDAGVTFGDEIKALARTLSDVPDVCAGCGQTEREDGKALLLCAKCKDEKYCSTACQKRRWKKHKKECTACIGEGGFGTMALRWSALEEVPNLAYTV